MMRLADLLSEASDEDLERLAHDHARTDETMSRAHLLATIEGVLRSHRFLQEFLLNRMPPTFSMLTVLLDAPELKVPTSGFREAVVAETERLCAALDAREILDRDDQLRVYRKVLCQARSNDALIDDAEAAILGVLRQELEIAQVEHYLIEHHADLREFWRMDAAFIRELLALRSAGIVYERNGFTLVPQDMAPRLRQVLGLDMSRPDAHRVFGYLMNPELHDALSAVQAPTSGSKEDRIERLLANMVQPRLVLRGRSIGIGRLREICRDVGTTVSGSKDELVDRIVSHVGADRDLVGEQEPAPIIQEPRALNQQRFALLFARLRGHELAALLSELDLRRWGSKEQQIRTLWDSPRSEVTLLSFLSSSDLGGVLKRLDLRPNGTKVERIRRLVEHFGTVALDAPASSVEGGEPDVEPAAAG